MAARMTMIHRYDGRRLLDTVGHFASSDVNQIHARRGSTVGVVLRYLADGKIVRYRLRQDWIDCGKVGISTDQYKIMRSMADNVQRPNYMRALFPLGQVWRYEGGST